MSIVALLVFTLLAVVLAGVIGARSFPKESTLPVLLGVAGAVAGGLIATALGFGSVTEFDVRSLLISIDGAVVLLCLYGYLKGF